MSGRMTRLARSRSRSTFHVPATKPSTRNVLIASFWRTTMCRTRSGRSPGSGRRTRAAGSRSRRGTAAAPGCPVRAAAHRAGRRAPCPARRGRRRGPAAAARTPRRSFVSPHHIWASITLAGPNAAQVAQDEAIDVSRSPGGSPSQASIEVCFDRPAPPPQAARRHLDERHAGPDEHLERQMVAVRPACGEVLARAP